MLSAKYINWHVFPAKGFKVCRYLFVRCDNEPAPWTRFVLLLIYLDSFTILSLLNFWNFNCSDEFGDRPRSLPGIPELKMATDVTERKESPAWDFDVSLCSFFSKIWIACLMLLFKDMFYGLLNCCVDKIRWILKLFHNNAKRSCVSML